MFIKFHATNVQEEINNLQESLELAKHENRLESLEHTRYLARQDAEHKVQKAKLEARLASLEALKLSYLDIENEKLDLLSREHECRIKEQELEMREKSTTQEHNHRGAVLDQQEADLQTRKDALIDAKYKEGHGDGYAAGYLAALEAIEEVRKDNNRVASLAVLGNSLKFTTDNPEENVMNVTKTLADALANALLEDKEK